MLGMAVRQHCPLPVEGTMGFGGCLAALLWLWPGAAQAQVGGFQGGAIMPVRPIGIPPAAGFSPFSRR